MTKHNLSDFKPASGEAARRRVTAPRWRPFTGNHNAVFEAKKLDELIEAFKKKSTNPKSLMHCDTYDVQKNERYNIESDKSYRPKICWVYLQPSQEWFKDINVAECEKTSSGNCEKLQELKERKGEFAHFPNYNTFFDDLGTGHLSVIKKTPEQANMLSQYTSWVVRQNACEISKELGLEINSSEVRSEYLPDDCKE